MKRAIGLFGGTFNPIHFGHLNLAIELKEKCHLSEVWWIPANISPFRLDEPPIEGRHRLQMISLAIERIPEFRVVESELYRPGPSYTIDTLTEVMKEGDEYALLLGEDALLHLKGWKEYEKIVQKVPLLIGCRQRAGLKDGIHSLGVSPEAQEAIFKGLVETTLMEISSTLVRKRLKQNLYCEHLVPLKVLDYIYENQLYFSSKS